MVALCWLSRVGRGMFRWQLRDETDRRGDTVACEQVQRTAVHRQMMVRMTILRFPACPLLIFDGASELDVA